MFATMSAARVTPRGLGRLSVRAVRVTLQFAALIAFAVTGMVLLSFAIAEPIALPIAQRAGTVPLADIAEARRLGSMWPLFAGGTVLAFGGGLVTIGALLQHLIPASDRPATS